METEAAGRELRAESSESGRTKTKIPSLFGTSSKLIEYARLKSAVASLNKANPGAPPLVLEALTEQQRAALVEEEREFVRKVSAENSKRRLAQYEAELAQENPPEEEEDPGKDEWDKRYGRFRHHLEQKRAGKDFSFEAISNAYPSHVFHGQQPGS